ncbi:hypothetical protein TWF281_000101 [Arthrobotrys megalospora]
MTDKPAKARIRDNQRRSRANKKEYIASLEQKLAEYNAQGVQATIEMQTAARAVALENERLRMLLNEVGVSPERVTSYLQSFGVPSEPQSQKPEIAKQPLCGKNSGITKTCGGGTCAGSRSPTGERVLPSPAEPQASTAETVRGACSEFGGDPSLETPCETAASIILQMKGNEDRSALYTKFGCKKDSTATCTIKNTDLFRIMDEDV